MIKQIQYLLTFVVVFTWQMTLAQTENTTLSVSDFAKMITEHPEIPLIDVRTPSEYDSGHIANAKNVDWKADSFQNETARLDKTEAILVYCLSGARSAKAASQMRLDGFTKVYELDGGLMKWRSKNLPEMTPSNSSEGMTKQEFDKLLEPDKLVLVDFYADWCAPCKKMEPYLKEISLDMKTTVEVVRIDVDKNKALCKILGVDALPVLQLYKNKNLVWSNFGFIEKADVVSQLEQH
ncbi:thioredoxin domain-containing protein [Formosa haliotis]|uniref:thioredoxin domain-containing protein n=1 Tax=Formosa haliotis TaxID=1555194 RepID=UPI0009F6F781|nr:thioredoxin domain-containing protein [Formosa haliotis]